MHLLPVAGDVDAALKQALETMSAAKAAGVGRIHACLCGGQRRVVLHHRDLRFDQVPDPVDVAGLKLGDADFMAGRYRFMGEGAGPGTVVNQGVLRAADGGYVALACNRNVPEIFSASIAWGTASVAEQTRAALQQHHLSAVWLPSQLDIDEPADLDRAIELGVITDWFLFCDDSMRIAPPLVITEQEIREACRVILQAIDES